MKQELDEAVDRLLKMAEDRAQEAEDRATEVENRAKEAKDRAKEAETKLQILLESKESIFVFYPFYYIL